ncbi:hypothetical protein ACRRTK_015423 [Alexandromys fortis]
MIEPYSEMGSLELGLEPGVQGQQQLRIKSGLIPGPQLQSVRFPTFYQGGKRGNFISGPPRYGVKSDKAPSRSPVPEIRSSDYIPGPNLPEAKLQHVKPVEGNVGPCLQAVKFSDLTPEPKHQGFRCTQVIPDIYFQDRKSQGLLPESFLPLSQEPQVEDRKLVLPMEVSEFRSRKHTIPASELQYPSVISQEVNPELRQQDTKFSELSRTEVSQPLTSNKQLQSANDHQVLSYNPVVISMGTPAPINMVREENALLKKDPRHALELNIDQRVLGLTEERLQPQRAQATDVELTARPPNQAETVNLTPRPSDQVIEPKPVSSLKHSATELKSMASRLSPVTDNMKVTPEKLLRIMDSMGLNNELHPHVIEPAEIAPKPQYQVMESAKPKVMDSTNLPPELQNVKSEHLIPDPRLRNMKSVDTAMDLVPEKVEYGPPTSRAVSTDLTLELHPLTMQFEELTHMPQLQKLALRHQAPEERVGSDVCHQVEESVELPQSSLGMRLIPLRQTSDSREMYSPPLQETLETRNQVVKEMEETPESQNAIKRCSGFATRIRSAEYEFSGDGPRTTALRWKVSSWDLESCSEITLRSEYEDRETIRVTFPKVDDTQGGMIEPYSEMGSLELGLEPGVQGKQAGDKEPEELPLGPNLKGLKSELLPSRPQLENRKSAVLTLGQCPERIKSTVVSPCSSQSDGTKTVKLIPGSTIQDLKTVGLARDTHVQDVNAMGLKLEPKQEESPVTFVPGIQFQDEFMEVLQVPQLQGIKHKELTAQSQMWGRKHGIISCLKPQSLKPVNIAKTQKIPGVKLVNLVSTQPCRGMAPADLTLKPGQDDQITVRSPEWKGRVLDQLHKHFESENVLSMKSGQEAKPADKKPKEIKFKVQFKDTPSFESTPKPVVHSVKPEEAQDEPHVPSMKPCQVTPGPQEHQVKVSEPMLEPPFQDVKTMVLTEPHTGSTKSVQWIPISEFQSVKSTEQKMSIQLGGVKPSETTVRPKLQEEKSVGFNLESQVHHTKTPELSPEPEIQKGENITSNSEPQPQGIKTVDQNQDPSVLSVRSIQWIPGPEFQSVKCLGLNRRSQSQGVKSTEQKPSIQLGGLKRPETTVRPKLQGNKSADFNLEPKVQHIKTPEASPKPELQEGENSEPQSECVKSVALHHRSEPQAECVKSVALHDGSEPQAECVKSVALHHGLQLENTKSVQWIPASVYQAKKSMLNLRLQSEDVTAKELNPLVQLRNVKISNELTTGLKLQSKQSTGSTPEKQSHGFKTTDFKPKLQFRSMKGCDPNLRSKINNIKFTFEPRFHLEVTGSPGLNPEMQPQEATLGSPPGTQPQSVTSLVFKQESQASEANYGVLSQRAQPQSSMELKSAKSSELALQTKPWDIKSEINSGPQWQSAECSDLTPETESQNMKCITSSQGKPFANRSVQLDSKHGSQWQGIKSNPGLRTKSQEMEMEDCESGPQLQDLKSSRTIMGIKVQDVISMGFTLDHNYKICHLKSLQRRGFMV